MLPKFKKKNSIGQGFMEYMLLLAIVIIILIMVLAKGGFISSRVRNSLDTVACGFENKLIGSCTQVCGDGSCSGTETTYSCCEDCPPFCNGTLPPPPPPVCGDSVCNGLETCSTCPGDCGACPPTNCPGGTSGSGATLCTVTGPVNNGATAPGGCAQLGTCSMSCNNGTPAWTNNCTAFNNCPGGTNGSGNTMCTVTGSVNHGASAAGGCAQLGTCSMSCNNGTPTWTNNCTAFANCPGGTNGSGATMCTVTGPVNHGASAAGACAQSGTCSMSCNNGTPAWTNTCAPTCGNQVVDAPEQCEIVPSSTGVWTRLLPNGSCSVIPACAPGVGNGVPCSTPGVICHGACTFGIGPRFRCVASTTITPAPPTCASINPLRPNGVVTCTSCQFNSSGCF